MRVYTILLVLLVCTTLGIVSTRFIRHTGTQKEEGVIRSQLGLTQTRQRNTFQNLPRNVDESINDNSNISTDPETDTGSESDGSVKNDQPTNPANTGPNVPQPSTDLPDNIPLSGDVKSVLSSSSDQNIKPTLSSPPKISFKDPETQGYDSRWIDEAISQIQDQYYADSGVHVLLSSDQILNCANIKDKLNGGTKQDALEYARSHDLCYRNTYQYHSQGSSGCFDYVCDTNIRVGSYTTYNFCEAEEFLLPFEPTLKNPIVETESAPSTLSAIICDQLFDCQSIGHTVIVNDDTVVDTPNYVKRCTYQGETNWIDDDVTLLYFDKIETPSVGKHMEDTFTYEIYRKGAATGIYTIAVNSEGVDFGEEEIIVIDSNPLDQVNESHLQMDDQLEWAKDSIYTKIPTSKQLCFQTERKQLCGNALYVSEEVLQSLDIGFENIYCGFSADTIKLL